MIAHKRHLLCIGCCKQYLADVSRNKSVWAAFNHIKTNRILELADILENSIAQIFQEENIHFFDRI